MTSRLGRPQWIPVQSSMSGRRVLVTGGSAFIGTPMVAALVRHGARVVSGDRRSPRRPLLQPHRTDLGDIRSILGNVYGPGRGGGQGGVIDQLVAAAAAGRPSVLHGDASATRDFVHGADVAEAALRAFMRPTAGRVSIGSRVETSVARVHALISDATEWTIPPRRGAPLAGEIDRTVNRPGFGGGSVVPPAAGVDGSL